MQQKRRLLDTRITPFLFGILLVLSSKSALAATESAIERMVEVEPGGLYQYSSKMTGVGLVPYRERRERWGGTAGVVYSTYQPENYEPDLISLPFDSVYGKSNMIEIEVAVKRNFVFGSIGGEFGFGFYSNESNLYSDGTTSTLTLYPVRLGLRLSLETMLQKPYLVPYGGAGMYEMFYKEKLASVSNSGNTQPALYWSAGALFNLDWIDPVGGAEAFENSGLQASYIFVEARQFMSSGAGADPDFGDSLHFNAGLKVEF
jgi:hypothetical protein